MKIDKINQTQLNNQNNNPTIETSKSQQSPESIFAEEEKTKTELQDKKPLSDVAKDTYTVLNDTFNKVENKLNKDFEELSKDLHLDKIINEVEMEGIDGGFLVSTGFTKESSRTNPENGIEISRKLEIKNGMPKKVLPDNLVLENNLKDVIIFQTSKIEVEQKYSYKNDDNTEAYAKTGFRKEIEENKSSLSETVGIGYKSSKKLWENSDETSNVSISNSGYSSLIYTDNFNSEGSFLTNQLALSNGLAASLSYQINPQFNITFSENGSYTISTKKDSYSFGSGVGVKILPISEEKDFKLHFGANYAISDYVKAKNSDNLDQKIGLTAKMDFNKNFGIETGYDIHLDKNNQNSFSFGINIR